MFNFLKEKKRKAIPLKLKREYMEELLKQEEFNLLLDELENIMFEFHKLLLENKVSLDFYKGLWTAFNLIKNYPQGIIIEEEITKEEENE